MIPRVIKKTVDLSKAQSVDTLTGPLYQLEEGGHSFEITVLDGGIPAGITGTVTARFVRADGTTVLFAGTLSENVVTITLPQNCYIINGRFGMVVFVSGTGVVSAVYAVSGTVYRSTTDTVIDPEAAVPSIEDLLGIIDDCETATAAAEAAAVFLPVVIAKAYPTTTPHDVFLAGEYCTKDNKLYKANTIVQATEIWTAAHWDQLTVGEALSGLGTAAADNAADIAAVEAVLDNTPVQRNSNGNISDLDIADENGNVLARMAGGHIKTKGFDSAEMGRSANLTTTAKTTVVDAINEVKSGADSTAADLATLSQTVSGIEDDLETVTDTVADAVEDLGNLEELVADITGDIESVVTVQNVNTPGVDVDLCDESGNVILRCGGGNVQTKNFDSAKAQKMILASGDSTDRAAEINAALAARGECKLGPGDFYVSGIVMPGSTTLSGCGAKTRIILLPSVTNGAAVKMKSYCTVKDVLIGTDESYTPSATPTTRYGIIRENDGDSHYIFGKISNVSIVGISQALALKDTVTADRTGLLVENVSIWKCDVGISITKCEYSRFSNIIIASCYTGVKNNAGNSLFANCTFISCTECFLMDDTSVTNSGHGSVVGCQFNHAGSNSGIAVKANGMGNGFVFSGCQFFASRIEITNSIGIGFHGCNFGGTSGQSGYQISVTNNDGTNRVLMIDNCIFATDLILSKTNSSGTTAVIVSNCYAQNGTQITAE